MVAPEVAAVAAAAIRLGAPVKWAEDRLENLVGAYQGRGIEGRLELALDADGRILGLRARLWADLGAYLLTTTPMPPHTAATLITGCYDIPAGRRIVTGARTHKVPTGPYRGAAGPDAAYLIEALIDEAARQTGIDPLELRRRNLVRTFPHKTPLGWSYDSGDYERCLDLALELVDARAPASAVAGGASASAVSCSDATPDAGDAPHGRDRRRAVRRTRRRPVREARDRPARTARFDVAQSSGPHGQGHDTPFAQIAADRLGVAGRRGDAASATRLPPRRASARSRAVRRWPARR